MGRLLASVNSAVTQQKRSSGRETKGINKFKCDKQCRGAVESKR
jgi:hypothetical protein